jgi:hypothetical protein
LPTPQLIELDAATIPHPGLTVIEHRGSGTFPLNAGGIALWSAREQTTDAYLSGYDLRRRLRTKPVLNANALDSVLKHPRLIPSEWKNKQIYFWGTIYRDLDDEQCVRYLYAPYETWTWGCSSLAERFYDTHLAALRLR